MNHQEFKETYILPKYKIPAHPGLQILMAIQDLEIMEQDERYKINMKIFHTMIDNEIRFCSFAGSVYARRILPKDSDRYDYCFHTQDYGTKLYELIKFLDALRKGYIALANSMLPKKWQLDHKDGFKYSNVGDYDYDYDNDPIEFKNSMKAVAKLWLDKFPVPANILKKYNYKYS